MKTMRMPIWLLLFLCVYICCLHSLTFFDKDFQLEFSPFFLRSSSSTKSFWPPFALCFLLYLYYSYLWKTIPTPRSKVKLIKNDKTMFEKRSKWRHIWVESERRTRKNFGKKVEKFMSSRNFRRTWQDIFKLEWFQRTKRRMKDDEESREGGERLKRARNSFKWIPPQLSTPFSSSPFYLHHHKTLRDWTTSKEESQWRWKKFPSLNGIASQLNKHWQTQPESTTDDE